MTETAPWGYKAVYCPKQHRAHIMPTWDIRAHVYENCWCEPMLDEFDHMVHKAADGRGRYEDGLARHH